MSATVSRLIERWVRPEIRDVQAYAVAPATGMIKLDVMENPYSLPAWLRQEIGVLVQELALNRYPVPSATDLIARLREVFGIDERYGVLLGNGSDELIQFITLAIARPDAVVLAPTPAFPMYRLDAQFYGARFESVSLRDDFSLDMPAMLAAIDRLQPALIWLAYPNNPTGNLYDTSDIEAILARAPGLVVLDEAYHAFADASFLPRLADCPNLIVLRTLSKVGLAGLRLGYMAAHPDWIDVFNKLRPPFNVNVLTQAVAEKVLRHPEVLAEQATAIKTERARLSDALRQLPGVTAFPSAANFVLARVPDANAANAYLQSRRILIKSLHGAHPILDQCLRLTVGTPEENHAVITALGEFFETSI